MGFVKTLLWGDEDANRVFENIPLDEDAVSWDAGMPELDAVDADDPLPVTRTYDPEQSIRLSQEREAAEVRERDTLAARVGHLSLAIESLLRLLKDNGVISDLDLRRMEQQVDLEDGHADGEFHPGLSPVSSHCPQCEARIPSGKRLCQLCGHRFPTE